MRFTTKLSAFMTLVIVLAMFLILLASTFSFFYLSQKKMEHRLGSIATTYDQSLLTNSSGEPSSWLPLMMSTVGVTEVNVENPKGTLYNFKLPAAYNAWDTHRTYRESVFPLLHQPGTSMRLTYIDPLTSYTRSTHAAVLLGSVVIIVMIILFFIFKWLRHQTEGEERLEQRASRILDGEREQVMRGERYEWPPGVSHALDRLLTDLIEEREERGRLDTLIRSFATQDATTGLHNRLFFESHLMTQLEEESAHGVVMMVRMPDFDTLSETHDKKQVQELMYSLVNLLSTLVIRYPHALSARYFRSDFVVLLPHKTLKDADTIAAQLINTVDALPSPQLIDREALLHIGIAAYCGGLSVEQVMDNTEQATRNAALYDANSWYVYDSHVPEKGRGSVRWRTLLEQTIANGGPRFYQKAAFTVDGKIHHYEIVSRIFDGKQELLSSEFMPLVSLLGLSESFDRQKMSRIIPLLSRWPSEVLAFSISVESLLQRSFQRWLRDTLLQCRKCDRQRILVELSEAELCKHIESLRPVIRLLVGLGCRLVVSQAGLTVVNTSYIKSLRVEIIKLHPGLVRNIELRFENQLIVQSLIGACKITNVKVFADEVRTSSEWQNLQEKGVYGGQGRFFSAPEVLSMG